MPGGGGSARVAQLEQQMAHATASGNFEMCISLREQIRTAKQAHLNEQIKQAAATNQFELCIQLKAQLDQL